MRGNDQSINYEIEEFHVALKDNLGKRPLKPLSDKDDTQRTILGAREVEMYNMHFRASDICIK